MVDHPPTSPANEDVVAAASVVCTAPSSLQKAAQLLYADGLDAAKKQAILHVSPEKGASSPMKKVALLSIATLVFASNRVLKVANELWELC